MRFNWVQKKKKDDEKCYDILARNSIKVEVCHPAFSILVCHLWLRTAEENHVCFFKTSYDIGASVREEYVRFRTITASWGVLKWLS